MKMDRRCFLSLGIGATAGLTLSPLPWKLTDDLSIWSQMWPWTPVPPTGAVTYEDSICTLCPGGCGIKVRKIDRRIVKIEGHEDHPVNRGGLCPLGMSGAQSHYAHNRILGPMMRTGERGKGQWRKISWTEAMTVLTSKLQALRTAGKPERLACMVGVEGGIVPELFRRFLTSFGSPNFIRMPSWRDAYSLAIAFMHGVEAIPGYDFENSDYVVSFGSGLLDGWGSPVRMFKANSQWKSAGAKLVQVEPRLSNTAAKADKWIGVRPGTEALIALGMAHVIISESLYDKSFVETCATGFEDWKDDGGAEHKGFKSLVLERFQPAAVAGMTGASAGDIETLAREFAAARQPVAVFGRGRGECPGGVHEAMSVHALNALVGAVEAKGGIWAMEKPEASYTRWPDADLDDVAKAGLTKARIDGAGTEKFPFVASLAHRVAGAINAAPESPVEILLVSGTNPRHALPDTAAVAVAFDRIPFVVSFASHMDDTAEMADLILPDQGHLERLRDIPSPAGLCKPYVGVSRPVVAPLGDTRNTGDVVIALAGALGPAVAGAFPWPSFEECLKATLKDVWKSIEANGYALNEAYAPLPWTRAFRTPSNKFQFVSGHCGHGDGAIAASAPGDETGFPLILVPYDSIRLATGPAGDPPFLMKTVEDTVLKGNLSVVQINPKTGGKLGLADGCKAVLSTPRGKITVKVSFYGGMVPGVVAMAKGLGHAGKDAYLADKGANVNALMGHAEDPISGLDAAWGIRASLVLA